MLNAVPFDRGNFLTNAEEVMGVRTWQWAIPTAPLWEGQLHT
jgi:hypothetical protein